MRGTKAHTPKSHQGNLDPSQSQTDLGQTRISKRGENVLKPRSDIKGGPYSHDGIGLEPPPLLKTQGAVVVILLAPPRMKPGER